MAYNLVAASDRLKMYSLSSETAKSVFSVPSDPKAGVSWSPDAELMAVTGSDAVSLLNKSGHIVKTIAHKDVTVAAFGWKTNRVLYCMSGTRLGIYDLQDDRFANTVQVSFLM